MMRPRESPALSSMTSAQRATPAGGAVRRANSRAISFGRNTKSTHPVSMALMGMLGKRADPGYCASVAPPPCLRACMPRAPSEPSPETATLFRERGEQNIRGMMQSAWVGCHANAPTGHSQRGICCYHVHVVLLHYRAVVRVYHRKNRCLAESFEQ